jgi:hypothetical protein
VSRARLGSANGEARLGRPLGLVVFEHERALLLRALRELVEREGPSRAAADLAQMLKAAAPIDALAECEA